jgi:hypothetical protein
VQGRGELVLQQRDMFVGGGVEDDIRPQTREQGVDLVRGGDVQEIAAQALPLSPALPREGEGGNGSGPTGDADAAASVNSVSI